MKHVLAFVTAAAVLAGLSGALLADSCPATANRSASIAAAYVGQILNSSTNALPVIALLAAISLPAVEASALAGVEVESVNRSNYLDARTPVDPKQVFYLFWEDGAAARSYPMGGKNRHYDLRIPAQGERVEFFELGSTKSTYPLRGAFRALLSRDELVALAGRATKLTESKVLDRQAIVLTTDLTSGSERTLREVSFVEIFPGKWGKVATRESVTEVPGGAVLMKSEEIPVAIRSIDDSVLNLARQRKEAKPSFVMDEARAAIGLAPCIECMEKTMKSADESYAKSRSSSAK